MNKEALTQQEGKQFYDFLIQYYLPNTDKINLSSDYQNPIFEEGAKILMQTINWSIKFINLAMYNIGTEGMQEIIKKGKQWPDLQELKLQRNKLSCQSVKGISECNWRNLTKLNLDKNNIRCEGFRQMVKSDWPQLKFLSMSHCQIGEEGGMSLKNANWPKLESINLNYNLITNEGTRELSSCQWPNLKILELSNNKIDGKGMFYISKLNSPNLKCLGLNRNHIGRIDNNLCDLGSFYLTHIKTQGLKQLHIFGNQLSLSGMRMIIRSGKLLQNCFLQTIRNLFSYGDIKPDIDQYKLFCNYFQN